MRTEHQHASWRDRVRATVADIVSRGHPRLAGALGATIVAAPLVVILLAAPIVATLIDRHRGGGILVDMVVVTACGIVLAVLAAAAIPGALWGPRALGPERLGRGEVLGMSMVAVAIGAAGIVMGLGALANGDGGGLGAEALTGGILLWSVGVGLLGLPALVIVVPHVLAWRSLMADLRQRQVPVVMEAAPGG